MYDSIVKPVVTVLLIGLVIAAFFAVGTALTQVSGVGRSAMSALSGVIDGGAFDAGTSPIGFAKDLIGGVGLDFGLLQAFLLAVVGAVVAGFVVRAVMTMFR
jgi:ABC-type nickel/cobalt efflux system permease component RcnA